MKQNFSSVIKKTTRKIVIHHCHLIKNIVDLLDDNDLVFFDDCLYSQFVFIKNNIQKLRNKHITCVLGFSTNLYRRNEFDAIYDINSAILHDRIHADDMSALNGFMSLNELNFLLKYDNIHLACHGCMHLQLEKICKSKIDLMTKFNDDLNNATKMLNELNLKTDIFVYPYAFDFFVSDKIVHKHGFNHIFAGKNSQRLEIEKIMSKK